MNQSVTNRRSLFFTSFFCLLFAFPVIAQKNTAQKYIEAHKERAIQIMEKYDIPASIVLAVAIHESAFGNSKLARYLNNHFGIKGKNTSTEIRSSYKGYNSVEDSYADFASFLQRRKQFNHLFNNSDRSDYRDWALGIAKGGYASSRTWSSQVINIIKKYELNRFDRGNSQKEYLANVGGSDAAKAYVVKSGDTLSKIAKEYNTTVHAIKQANELRNAQLKIGQELSL